MARSPRPVRAGTRCANAYHALTEAGYQPEVIRSYGLGVLPAIFNNTAGRREVGRLTGRRWVPVLVLVLVTDDGTVIKDSSEIVAWAKDNPAVTAAQAAPGAG